MTVLKPQEIEIDIKRFMKIPELKDGHDSDDEKVVEQDKGYTFIMDEIQKVYQDDITDNVKFVGTRRLNDDVVQTL